MFFYYRQNNSGGSFDFDKERGITHHVFIEADSSTDADGRAESIGLYFDGCDSGMDCPCCGDRWSEAWEDGHEEPTLYGEIVDKNYFSDQGLTWMKEGFNACVHYKDGRKEWF